MNKLKLFALIKFVFSTNNCSESYLHFDVRLFYRQDLISICVRLIIKCFCFVLKFVCQSKISINSDKNVEQENVTFDSML